MSNDTSDLLRPGDPSWMQNAARPRADADGAAIASLILAFFFPPLGIIFGHVSRGQAKRRGLQPSAVTNWGTVLGWVFTALIVIIVIAAVVAASQAADPTQQYIACLNQQLNNPSLVCTAPSP